MLVSIFFVLSLACASNGQSDGLTIRTRQGDVIGSLVTPHVRQFLGVPYAVANRWAAPKTPHPRSSPFHANIFGDSCVQALNAANLEFFKLARSGDPIVPESEDCLSVNIWAPSTKRKQHTSVMLWVYGGSFQFGTTNQPAYIGRNLVQDNDDVLVVTFNYRTNIFGFPNAPQLVNSTQSQNFGLLDLDAAVQWVHDNIGSFGGDPERIILFGHSAGATAIDAYSFAHPHDTIVKGIIEQSGNLGLPITGAVPSRADINVAAWNQVASAVGCGNVTNAAQLTCMEAIPFRTLENIVINASITFDPVADGINIFSDTAARSASGQFLRVPLLAGTTAQEGDIFIVGNQEVATGIVIPGVTELLSDLMTQIIFTCPTGKTTGDRITAGVPTWRYQYQGIFPDISSRPDLRAYHASEIPVIFNTFGAILDPPPTSAEVRLSKYMQSAWVAFARDPKRGLVNFGWPMYSPDTTNLAQIGNFFNETGVVFTTGSLLDFTCGSVSVLRSV